MDCQTDRLPFTGLDGLQYPLKCATKATEQTWTPWLPLVQVEHTLPAFRRLQNVQFLHRSHADIHKSIPGTCAANLCLREHEGLFEYQQVLAMMYIKSVSDRPDGLSCRQVHR